MGPIPKELNLDRFVGQQLQQICMGAYDVQFRFIGDDRIRCTGTVLVELDGLNQEVFGTELWKDANPLHQIVGRDVTGWRIESTHTLAIFLSDEAVIRFVSEDSPYEDIIIDPEVQVW